jgi:hypothetical protein
MPLESRQVCCRVRLLPKKMLRVQNVFCVAHEKTIEKSLKSMPPNVFMVRPSSKADCHALSHTQCKTMQHTMLCRQQTETKQSHATIVNHFSHTQSF